VGTVTIHPERVHPLNDAPARQGRYVLYWMQQSQRAEHNDALEWAVRRANRLGLPVVVGFGLMDGYPGANLRHYRFMLEGLTETARAVERRRMTFVLRRGDPADVALELARDAAAVVCDRGYLRHQRAWRERVARDAGREVVEVEADAVVPVESASDKAEFAARTIRPRIQKRLDEHLEELRTTPVKNRSRLRLEGEDLADPDALLSRMELDRSVGPVSERFRGGTAQARARLVRFLDDHLDRYDDARSKPTLQHVSTLSPYLHFGQISPVYVARFVREHHVEDANVRGFVEELVVRRGLAQNFVWYRRGDYDSFSGLPDWARRTLREHAGDEREHVYSKRELAEGRTHDAYWNAAMREMRLTGYLHNHLRMYWGKKILEWSNTPERARAAAQELNDTYLLDGRDPSSFANVGWLFGLHDRPWQERPIFGKVRYMSASGLERKIDTERYLRRVDAL